MRTTEEVNFAHRLAGDRQFDSICLRCFRTVGSAELESGLESSEARHVCLPEDLITLYGRRGPERARGPERGSEQGAKEAEVRKKDRG